jgi:hypothetical protein
MASNLPEPMDNRVTTEPIMGIFTDIVIPPAAPAVVAAATLVQNSNQLYAQLTDSFWTNYNLVWNNPYATPDLVVTALGVNGQMVFMASAGLADYMNAMGADPQLPNTLPPGWNYQANADGSVTLTAQS